jgi:hypothetical protein
MTHDMTKLFSVQRGQRGCVMPEDTVTHPWMRPICLPIWAPRADLFALFTARSAKVGLRNVAAVSG